jgi:RNase P/RNase MRP subunit POP5
LNISKNNLIKEIKKNCYSIFNKNFNEIGIYLIKFNGDKGIIKCNNMNKDTTIKLLKSIEKISKTKIKIITIGTSGTIKSLIKKHMIKEIIKS